MSNDVNTQKRIVDQPVIDLVNQIISNGHFPDIKAGVIGDAMARLMNSPVLESKKPETPAAKETSKSK